MGKWLCKGTFGLKWGFRGNECAKGLLGENGHPKGLWVKIGVLWENGCAKGLLG